MTTNNNNVNKITLQLLLINKNNNKMLSSYFCIDSLKELKYNRDRVIKQGLQKICDETNLTGKELIKQGYSIIKIKLATNKRKGVKE